MNPPIFTVENIPVVMREAKQWIPVKLERNSARWSKLPRCKWSDASTHRRFADVGGYAAFVAGGGFVTNDWDDCVHDGIVDAAVLAQVRALDTYAEISLSGTGVHAVAYGGPLPRGRCCEMWDAGHYVVITGYHIAGTPTTVEHRQEQLVRLSYDLTPGGMVVAETQEYVVPEDIYKSARTRELFKQLRSLKGQGDSFDGAKAFLRTFDRERCHPSKIAEKGEQWYDDWFRRSWHQPDRAQVTFPDNMFRL